MKPDYSQKTNEELHAEQEKLHKKLRPANIAILIISLIALITLLVGPCLKMKMNLNKDFFVGVMEQSIKDDDPEAEEMRSTAEFMFKDVNKTVVVSVTPSAMIKAAFASDTKTVKDFLTDTMQTLLSSFEDVGQQVMPAMIGGIIITQWCGGIPEDSSDISTQELKKVIDLLAENKVDEATAKVQAAAAKFAQDEFNVTLTAENLSDVQKYFDDIVEAGTDEQGDFSFMQVLMMMSGGSSESGSEGSSESKNPIEQIFSQIENMDDTTVSQVKMALTATSVAGVLLSAFCWLMLALLSLVHIFAKNKKVAMWYVKLTGLLPCLLFVIAPSIAMAIAPEMAGGGQSAAMIGSMGMTFGGLTIISAVCLLVLWGVSIFWCHPIKKKIKACKKQLNMNNQ